MGLVNRTPQTIVGTVPCPDPALFADLRRAQRSGSKAAGLRAAADEIDAMPHALNSQRRHAESCRAAADAEMAFAAAYVMPTELVEWFDADPRGLVDE